MTDETLNLDYIRRRLTSFDEAGNRLEKVDTELIDVSFPLVILGEPGMGKTRLLKTMSLRIEGALFVRAAALVRNPTRYANSTGPLVVDALDEVASLQEGDPLHNVLTALSDIDQPDFIVSCRSADWRSVSGNIDIFDDYGRKPSVWRLEPISAKEAGHFLQHLGVSYETADSLMSRLEEQNLSDLYGNPLTLKMLSKVAAASHGAIPSTRAELFRQAVDVLRSETSNFHFNSELAKLSKEDALNGAGAVFAALLLTGKEFILLEQSGEAESNQLVVADAATLPGGTAALAVCRSRLFQAADEGQQLVPIHRTIAEFLGALWLSKQIEKNDRIASRVFSLMTVEGMVPASLRGLHAWLGQSPPLSDQVITNDPYGLLRYGDPNSLGEEQALRLLDALQRLEESDPYFRGDDWDSYTAASLVSSPLLEDRLKEMILDGNLGFHLRTLLLEIIQGTSLVPALAIELESMVRSEARFYRERREAAMALLSDRSISLDWVKLVDELRNQGTGDSTRLTIKLILAIGVEEFTADLIGQCVLAATGFGQISRHEGTVYVSGVLWTLADILPLECIPIVLETITDALKRKSANDKINTENWDNWYELSTFVHSLLLRQIDRDNQDAEKLWHWLSIFSKYDRYHNEDQKELAEYFRSNVSVRRGIQKHVLFSPAIEKKGSLFAYWLARVSVGLALTEDDAVFHLRQLHNRGIHSENDRETFRSIVLAVNRTDVLSECIETVAGNDEQLLEFLDPKPSEEEMRWREEKKEIEAERLRVKLEKEKRWQKNREDFLTNEDKVRSGTLRWIAPPAKAYLAMFSDINSEKEPSERISYWLGNQIAEAAIAGFEATLHRTDLPSSNSVAKSYADGRFWHFIHPIIAGLAERWRNGRGFADLSAEVVITGWFGLMGELIEQEANLDGLTEALREYLASDQAVFESALRGWFEPHLDVGKDHIYWLRAFARGAEYADIASSLSADWLQRFPDISSESEIELVHCLVCAPEAQQENAWAVLKKLAEQRVDKSYLSSERSKLWLSVRFLVNFDGELLWLGDSKTLTPDMLWSLRSIITLDHSERRGPITLSPAQLHWIVHQFRQEWPAVEQPHGGVVSGDTNPFDATKFIEWVIGALASQTSSEAIKLLVELSQIEDGYTQHIRAAIADQRRANIEKSFQSPTLESLASALKDSPPRNTAELQAVIISALEDFQKRLRGNTTNTIRRFYTDEGKPRAENDCRDMLVDLLGLPFEIQQIPEEQMPAGKRVDVGYRLGELRVPLEAKGQWNRNVWNAASTQLDTLYSIDHQADGRGIYLVFWFGRQAPAGRRLKRPPNPLKPPDTPETMQMMLEDIVPPGRRDAVAIFVLDLEARKPVS